MQESLNASPTWPQTVFGLIAALLTGGGIVKLWNTYLNRRKPAAEVQLTQATATEVTIRAGSSASDAVMRMMDRLDQAQLTIDRLRSERDQWQDQYDKAFTERDELLRQNGLLQKEAESYESQLVTMRATLKANRLNFDNTQGVPLNKPEP